jgi:MraZ protein
MLFRGRSFRTLDLKGRLMLPPDFREILLARSEPGQLVLTTRDGCIYGFPWPDWQKIEEAFSRIQNPGRAVRDFSRQFLGGAEVMAADGQGRIRLSRELTAYAGIEKDVVLVGQGARFAIWDPDRFAPVLAQNFDDVTLADSGIELNF